MAALPSPTQVAGSHTAIYEAYYNQVDPNGYGRIGAMEAARFLKKSQLSDIVLSKIWDMADPQARGSLDKSGLFVALKLCALAQSGRDLSMNNINLELPPPKMGEIPIIPQKPPVNAMPVITNISSSDWTIKPSERAKYDLLFDSLQPSNGYIPGAKVKDVLMDSKLQLDTLGKIWDLADMDKDGMLDRHEFMVAMHLVYKALEKHAIPNTLPPELMPPGKRKDVVVSKPPVAVDVITAAPPPIPPLPNASVVKNLTGLDMGKKNPPQWVVSNKDMVTAERLFLEADLDMDGYVSGLEIKDVFLQSGLRQAVLADIWGLCDTCQTGKLNKEQFALAMWLIKQKLNGVDPPPTLLPEMVPPSMRKGADNIVENNNIPTYSNPELDMISKDIVELVREIQTMEQDIAQKEADIKIKNGEIKSLQSELDTLAATLKQLENQKGEAQKRLNDLRVQKAEIDKDLSQVEQKICEEQKKVDKLRQQAEEQESVLRAQEDELNSKRQELEGLRQEEQQLEQQQNKSRDQLNELTKNLQETQLQICQAKGKITDLEEQQRQMSDAIALYDSALATGDASIVPDTSLQFNPEIEDIESPTRTADDQKDKTADAFSNVNGTVSGNGFGDQDPFSSNRAKEAFSASTPDPFASAFPSEPIASGFTSDPFGAFDNNTGVKQDPFDPFGNGKKNDAKTATGTTGTKDPFGDDPFANLHAPTRPESPSPALPPKKAKQPPPRPAPPRPSLGPTGPLRAAPAAPTPSPTPDPFTNANVDPFASQQGSVDNNNTSSFNTSTGFADFANFDSKPEPIPNRSAPPRPVGRMHTVSMLTRKLPDFTEDPFRDYRYEDPFNITDPFAEDVEDFNANKSNDPMSKAVDPFGYGTSSTFTNKNSQIKGFDNDFTNTFPLTKNKLDTNNVKFNADFEKAFSDDNNKNIKTVNGGGLMNTTDNTKAKSINLDEIFANKGDRDVKKQSHDQTHPRSKINFNNKKLKNDVEKIWNGNNISFALTEEEQVAWASQQSIEAEEERRKRKEQEEADLALALELSKQEKSGKL